MSERKQERKRGPFSPDETESSEEPLTESEIEEQQERRRIDAARRAAQFDPRSAELDRRSSTEIEMDQILREIQREKARTTSEAEMLRANQNNTNAMLVKMMEKLEKIEISRRSSRASSRLGTPPKQSSPSTPVLKENPILDRDEMLCRLEAEELEEALNRSRAEQSDAEIAEYESIHGKINQVPFAEWVQNRKRQGASNLYTPLSYQTHAPAARKPRRETMFDIIEDEGEDDVGRLSNKYEGTGMHSREQEEQLRRSILNTPRNPAAISRPSLINDRPLPPLHSRRNRESTNLNESTKFVPVQNATGVRNQAGVQNDAEIPYTGLPLFTRPPAGSVPPPPQFTYTPAPQIPLQQQQRSENVYEPHSSNLDSAQGGKVPLVQNPYVQHPPHNFHAGNTGNLPQTNSSNHSGQSTPPDNNAGRVHGSNPYLQPPLDSFNVPGAKFQSTQNPFRDSNLFKNNASQPLRKYGDMGMLQKITDAIANPLHGTYMTQMLPSYEKIMLYKLNPRAVINFIDEVYDYTAQHNVSFKITSRIDKAARHIIINRNSDVLDAYNFHLMDNSQTVKVLQYTVRPLSKPEFIDNMKTYVPFRMVGNGTYEEFEQFYDALSRYRRQWVMYFEFMSEYNTSAVPHCNYKKDGLINLFIGNIPNGYGHNRANVLVEQKFRDIVHFIECFWVEVEKDYERSRAQKILQRGFDPIGSKDPDKKEKERPKEDVPKRKPPFNNFKSKALSNVTQVSEEAKEDGEQSVQDRTSEFGFDEDDMPDQIASEDGPDEDNLESDREIHPSDDPDFDRGPVESSVSAVQPPRPQDKFNSRTSDPKYNSGSAKFPSTKTSTKPPFGTKSKLEEHPKRRRGCFFALRKEGCDKADCKYSHDPEDLKLTWKDLVEMTSNSSDKYGSKKSDGRPDGGNTSYPKSS